MEIFLIKALQLILAISLLVLLHEGGHFFFSKLFGVRVEKFYLFFDVTVGKWKGSLFKFKPKNSDTQYGIGWLPLGGYCKIAGMIDESMDTEQMKQPEQPWEFRSHPTWQRLLIMIGGVLVNFLLGLFIYSMVLYTWGDEYIATKDMTMGMKFNEEAKALGLRDHDILIGTDQGDFKDFGPDLFRDLATAKEIHIIRGGKPMTLQASGEGNLLEMLQSRPRFCEPFIPAVVDSVPNGTLASKMGLRAGDKILAVNGKRIDSYNEFTFEVGRITDILKAAETREDSLAAKKVSLMYLSKADGKVYLSKATLPESLLFGFYVKTFAQYYDITHVEYSFFESIPAGIKYGWNVLAGYVGDLKYLFSADGAKSLGGFGAIGNLFPATWDWHAFWLMTALLSIILAFMNILPIPALDGGHVVFLLYEMITGKKPSENVLIKAEYIGFGLVILLMIVANLNDILRWLGYM